MFIGAFVIFVFTLLSLLGIVSIYEKLTEPSDVYTHATSGESQVKQEESGQDTTAVCDSCQGRGTQVLELAKRAGVVQIECRNCFGFSSHSENRLR